MSEQTQPETQELPETLEPLTALEASLVGMVGQWREENTKRLEAEFQAMVNAANAKIAPVLAAHGLAEGDLWEIREDANSVTGWALAIKKGGLAADRAAAAELPRGKRRAIEKEIRRTVGRKRIR